MAKFLFILVLVLFAGAGFYFLLFVQIEQAEAPAANSPRIKDYASLIIKDDFNLRSLVSRIAGDCPEDGKEECVLVKIFKYVKSEVKSDGPETSSPSPLKALRERRGSPLETALLLASFTENAGIASKIAEKGGKLYAYACGLDVLQMYKEIKNDLRQKPLASRDILLRKGQMWAVELRGEEPRPITADIEAAGSGAFDMFLFPSKYELEEYLKNGSGRYLPDCSRLGVTTLQVSCLSPREGVLLFVSKEDGNNFHGAVYRGGVILSDIKTDAAGCLPMDVSSSGAVLSYPGVSLLP